MPSRPAFFEAVRPSSTPQEILFPGAVDQGRSAARLGGSAERLKDHPAELIFGNLVVRSLLVSAGTRSCTGNRLGERSLTPWLRPGGGERRPSGTIYSSDRRACSKVRKQRHRRLGNRSAIGVKIQSIEGFDSGSE
jgi:hypothetical protein